MYTGYTYTRLYKTVTVTVNMSTCQHVYISISATTISGMSFYPIDANVRSTYDTTRTSSFRGVPSTLGLEGGGNRSCFCFVSFAGELLTFRHRLHGYLALNGHLVLQGNIPFRTADKKTTRYSLGQVPV